jgi:hypothetical protein
MENVSSAIGEIGHNLSVLFGVWQEGDHRDWNTIRAWAESLAPLLNLEVIL